MSFDYSDLLGDLDSPGQVYPPFNHLLPYPQSLVINIYGGYELLSGKVIAITSPEQRFTAQRLQSALAKLGIQWEIAEHQPDQGHENIGVQFEIKPLEHGSGAYELEIEIYNARNKDFQDGIILLAAHDLSGLWNGVCTLTQAIQLDYARAGKDLAALWIKDWPDFARRGVMLDISRDKVPTLDTLKALIDRLAGWKINEVQLYMEHTFAYQDHETVWKNASPLTGAEIRELDQFCRERFVDLVPNQNSFGHMHRWLMHEEYRHLAEIPEGLDWPIFISQRPFSVTATPESVAFMGKLYDELLPNFTSQYFNVGCDETFDLGKGRSKALVEEQGKGRVYVDYLKQIAAQVAKHGRTMQFWGDIIMQHPELVPELPKGVIAMEWGYDANDPFDSDGEKFAAAGVPFYVCPGTSSWLTLVGRTENAIANLRNAAVNGQKHGAIGYLNTDWGDYGHWQALLVSYLGFAYGAALSWAVQPNLDMDIPTALNLFAFEDSTGVMGQLAYDLGNVYRVLDDQKQYNGGIMVRALYFPLDQILEQKWLSAPINPEKVRAAMIEMERLAQKLGEARLTDPLIVPEYKLAIALWLHGCKRLLMVAGDTTITKPAMAAELHPLRDEFTRLWLARNRPGGLSDSLVRMDRLFAEYEGG